MNPLMHQQSRRNSSAVRDDRAVAETASDMAVKVAKSSRYETAIQTKAGADCVNASPPAMTRSATVYEGNFPTRSRVSLVERIEP